MLEQIKQEEWEHYLNQCSNVHIMQTNIIANTLFQHCSQIYWIQNCDNSCIGAAVIYDPTQNTYSIRYGPVISGIISEEDINKFLTYLTTIFHKSYAYYFYYNPLIRDAVYTPIITRILMDQGFEKTEWQTSLVDLTHSEEALLNSFKHSARKGIRKCLQKNITVMRCGTFPEFMEHYIKPYLEIKNLPLKEESYYRGIWERQDIFAFFYAKEMNSNKILGCLGTYRFRGKATEIYSATHTDSYTLSIPVQDIIHWEAIKHHQALGDQIFDLAGFAAYPSTPKEEGIKNFKLKWGGQVVDQPIFCKKQRALKFLIIRTLKKAEKIAGLGIIK